MEDTDTAAFGQLQAQLVDKARAVRAAERELHRAEMALKRHQWPIVTTHAGESETFHAHNIIREHWDDETWRGHYDAMHRALDHLATVRAEHEAARYALEYRTKHAGKRVR